MPIEGNKALALRIAEKFSGKYEVIDEIYDKNYLNPIFNIRGLESIRQWVLTYRNAFPDIKFSAENQIAEGDKVTTRWSIRPSSPGPAGLTDSWKRSGGCPIRNDGRSFPGA